MTRPPMIPDWSALPLSVRQAVLRDWRRKYYRCRRFWIGLGAWSLIMFGGTGFAAWIAMRLRLPILTIYAACITPLVGLYVFMSVFAPAFQRHWRRVLRETGYCVNCFYNLSGNVSGTCPECGTPIRNDDPPPR